VPLVLRELQVHKAHKVQLHQEGREQQVHKALEVRKAQPVRRDHPRQGPMVLKELRDQQEQPVLPVHKVQEVHKGEQVPKGLLHNYNHQLLH
jgi:hypothetical protein